MGLRDRYKGLLATIKRKFYRGISEATGEIEKPLFKDISGKDPQVLSFSQRAQAYLPPPIERKAVTIPISISPFTDQVVLDKFEQKYRDVKTGLFVGRTDYQERLSSQKRNVLLASVARKERGLTPEEIGGLVDALMDRRNAINDIARDNEHRLKLLDEDEDYNDIKDLLGLVSP